jgi:hypothetical protein
MTTQPPKDEARTTGSRARLQAWLPRIALIAGLVAAAAVGGYLWLSGGGGGSSPPATAAPKRGVACPQLREAFEQNQNGNEPGLRRSVTAAARAGEQALDRSGQVFGRPEEIALELQYVLTGERDRPRKEVAMYLGQARRACERLGRWAESS